MGEVSDDRQPINNQLKGESWMFFIPMGVGIIVGLILLYTSSLIRKNSGNPIFVNILGYSGIIAGLILFVIGYVYVRGFQGLAYIMCAIPIFIFAIIVLFKDSCR